MNERSAAPSRAALRQDLQIIADLVAPQSRVLDVGCGDGALLDYFVHAKRVDGRGIELSQAGVNSCVTHGLSVVQGDADTDLYDYPAQSFDYVILSQTLQATRRPREVLSHLVRIGRYAVVSLTNHGHWRVRLELLFRGRIPIMGAPGHGWFDSPNIHPCTTRDFVRLCRHLGLVIEHGVSINRRGKTRAFNSIGTFANLMGQQSIFLLRRK